MSEATAVAAELVLELVRQLPGSGFRLAGIEVHLGAELDLDAAILRESLDQAIVESGLGKIEIQISVIPGGLRCLDCGAEYPSDEHPCPVCGSPNAMMIHGRELAIARAWGASG